uniref:Uncharacterized protein n=1 Tax=Picea sitchensis TaxID=3332 RepID=A9NY78_PICSI|nr:unknown [Picea sitchensis]
MEWHHILMWRIFQCKLHFVELNLQIANNTLLLGHYIFIIDCLN